MSIDIPADLQRPGRFGRFPAQTEALYRDWGVRKNLPLVRLVGFFSIAVWLGGPFMVAALVGSRPSWIGVGICWANAVVITVLLLLAARRPQIWQAVASLYAVTLDSLLIVHETDVNDRPSVMLALTIYFVYFAPVTRIPTRSTAAYLTVALPVAFLAAAREAAAGDSWDTSTGFIAWLLLASAFFVLVITYASEADLRRQYVDEQLLARQRAQLEASRTLIRRYAPAAVVDRLEHGDETVGAAQRQRVTIFFADVVGFTTMADRLDPEALAEIVNDYLGGVAEIVDRYGGTLNEFAGDGVMAIFGAPDAMAPADQVRAALVAARELQSSLPEWSRRWYPLGIDQDLRARVGINTGVVSVGTFGSAVRATYTGIGLQTNIAARVQSECPAGSVLLSATSWHLVKDEIPCEPRGQVMVKGVHFPIELYEPVSTGSTTAG